MSRNTDSVISSEMIPTSHDAAISRLVHSSQETSASRNGVGRGRVTVEKLLEMFDVVRNDITNDLDELCDIDEKLSKQLDATADNNQLFDELIGHGKYILATCVFCLGNVWYYPYYTLESRDRDERTRTVLPPVGKLVVPYTENTQRLYVLLWTCRRYGAWCRNPDTRCWGYVIQRELTREKLVDIYHHSWEHSYYRNTNECKVETSPVVKIQPV